MNYSLDEILDDFVMVTGFIFTFAYLGWKLGGFIYLIGNILYDNI